MIGGYSRFGELHSWLAGIHGELGASYFFNPHASLGAAGELRASYRDERRDEPGSYVAQHILVSGVLVRVLGAVYF